MTTKQDSIISSQSATSSLQDTSTNASFISSICCNSITSINLPSIIGRTTAAMVPSFALPEVDLVIYEKVNDLWLRTNTINSQSGYNPNKPMIPNNEHDSNIDKMLSNAIVKTDQSLVQLSATNMITTQNAPISNHEQNDIATTRAANEGRQQQQRLQPWQQTGHHQPRRQALQQGQEQQQRQHQRQLQSHQQNQQQQQQQQRQQQRRRRRYEQWQERVFQRHMEREHEREQRQYADQWLHPDLYDVLMMEEIQDALLDAYDYEKMDEPYKWEQEQIHKFEQQAAIAQQAAI
ncbi:unnamed protein product [Rotaria sordida]|uniref:Uncharacterized protein n=1 Tax=Rotaria sordida TaxID=392033 RepID=A0A815QMW7_9BILA|nr:unnamed protein product [Rotaria sordida]CAF1643109.1 unnamed protein product [Rotaria sordida]